MRDFKSTCSHDVAPWKTCRACEREGAVHEAETKCEHDACLIFGREEEGGRRFPLRWCQNCGAVSIDTGPHPGRGWLFPDPDYVPND